MLFNSYSFVIFLLFVIVASRIIRSWKWRKCFLLIFSYLFYAAWNPPFVILLWISTLIDWFVAKRIYTAKSKFNKIVAILISLTVNLGMLAYFKYGNFLLDSFNDFFSYLNVDYQFGEMSIILPVGISFYTFQTLSYTIDIYRGNMKPGKSFLDYALYVTFFPQLVAGPIVRASEFLPQCLEAKVASFKQIAWGLQLLLIGLFCKVFIADTLMEPVVEKVYGGEDPSGFLSAWTGTLAFSMQIFYDFYGYSICAIGVALCLGFILPDNFQFPYAAKGFSDFWKRWHITLSSWLRDYLYIPLGGNRKGIPRTYINLMITMLLGGLWHGASWMFVIWGALHGLYLIIERLIKKTNLAKFQIWQSLPGNLFIVMITYFLVCITWTFFRATDLNSAVQISTSMLNFKDALLILHALVSSDISITTFESNWLHVHIYLPILALVILNLIFHYFMKNSNLETAYSKMPYFCRIFINGFMLFLVLISMTGDDHAFIYFQF